MPNTPARLFLKPAAGLTVRDPVSKIPLPPYGKSVEASSIWQRRLMDGDVTETTEAEITAGAAAAAAAPTSPATAPAGATPAAGS